MVSRFVIGFVGARQVTQSRTLKEMRRKCCLHKDKNVVYIKTKMLFSSLGIVWLLAWLKSRNWCCNKCCVTLTRFLQHNKHKTEHYSISYYMNHIIYSYRINIFQYLPLNADTVVLRYDIKVKIWKMTVLSNLELEVSLDVQPVTLTMHHSER